MLVLTRQKDETIMIGDDIEVTVVEIRGDRVRLGIRAPQSVTIHRKEVYLAIQEANVEAARAHAAGLERLKEVTKIIGQRREAGKKGTARVVPATGSTDSEPGSAPEASKSPS